VRRWTTAYEMLCDETRHHVHLNSQNRTIPLKNEREKLIEYLQATLYDSGSVGVSELNHVGTCVRAQRIEIEKMGMHTRISERTHTVTNDEDYQNKSSIQYNKSKDMNAAERTRLSNLTTHLLNLKMFLRRITQEYQWEKPIFCLTKNWIFSLVLALFPERTFNKNNRTGLGKITNINIYNKMMTRMHSVLVYLLPLINFHTLTHPLTLPLAVLAHVMSQDLRNYLHRDHKPKSIQNIVQNAGVF